MVKIKKNKELEGHKDAVYVLEPISESGFISAGGDGMVALWDLESGKDAALLAKLPNSIYALKYFSDSNTVLVGHNYDGIHEIDILSKKEIRSLTCVSGAIYAIDYLGDNIYIGDSKGTLTIIDYHTFLIVDTIQLSSKSIRTICNDGQNIFIGTSTHNIYCLDVNKNITNSIELAHKKTIFALKVCGDRLYSVGGDACLKVWDTKDMTLIKEVVAHMYTIHDIVFREDGECFATSSMDKTIKIWDTNTCQLLKVIDNGRYESHKTSVNKLLWSSYNQQLVSCSDDRKIMVWDINLNSYV